MDVQLCTHSFQWYDTVSLTAYSYFSIELLGVYTQWNLQTIWPFVWLHRMKYSWYFVNQTLVQHILCSFGQHGFLMTNPVDSERDLRGNGNISTLSSVQYFFLISCRVVSVFQHRCKASTHLHRSRGRLVWLFCFTARSRWREIVSVWRKDGETWTQPNN